MEAVKESNVADEGESNPCLKCQNSSTKLFYFLNRL